MPTDVDVLTRYCRATAEQARAAAAVLSQLPRSAKDEWLRRSARELRDGCDRILRANDRDLQSARAEGLSAASLDRLALDPARIEGIAQAMESVAELPDPVGERIESTIRPNGLRIEKIRVPLGVVFFIYESRPNVTADAAAICVKSGNAVILRCGKEAAHTSRAIVEVLHASAASTGIPAHAVQLVEPSDRQAVRIFLRLNDLIDLAIPRGGEGLIRAVAEEARMPVIKHFTGNCHVYVDRAADVPMALELAVNSKCQRMGVCNACESLLVHRDLASQFIPKVTQALQARGIEIRADQDSLRLFDGGQPASEEDYYQEFLGPIVSLKTVATLDEAIDHINRYGSHHTDAIVTSDEQAADRFAAGVDSAAVMINASTRFHDGGEFGLGAEIGISTDKFHARGPCGLRELTSYKYVCRGQGQVRN
jgi:glutamate-5-semialdehyde dehydrogenase